MNAFRNMFVIDVWYVLYIVVVDLFVLVVFYIERK